MALLASALYDNEAEVHDELTFRRGEQLVVLDSAPAELDGWWICSCRGRTGLAPANRLRVVRKLTDTAPQNGAITNNLPLQHYQTGSPNYQIPTSPNYEYPADVNLPVNYSQQIPDSYEHYQVPMSDLLCDLDSNRSSGISVASNGFSSQGAIEDGGNISKDSAVEEDLYDYDTFTLRTVPLRLQQTQQLHPTTGNRASPSNISNQSSTTGSTASSNRTQPLPPAPRTLTPPRSAKTVTFAAGDGKATTAATAASALPPESNMVKSMTPFDFYDIPSAYMASPDSTTSKELSDDTGIYDFPVYGIVSASDSVCTELTELASSSSRESVRTPVQRDTPPPQPPPPPPQPSPPIELHSQTESLKKFSIINSSFTAAAERLYSFIHSRWKEEPSLTLNMPGIRDTCNQLRHHAHDFLRFCQSVLRNARRTKDVALTRKLSQHINQLETLYNQLVDTINHMERQLRWSPKFISVSSQKTDTDVLGRLVSIVRDSNIDMRSLWNAIQGNANLLFPNIPQPQPQSQPQPQTQPQQYPSNRQVIPNAVSQVWQFYATQVITEKSTLDTAVSEFHECLLHKAPPQEFVARCKHLVVRAQMIVRSAECLQRSLQAQNGSSAEQEVELARELCDLLKKLIESTKLASEQYPLEEPQRKLKQLVTEVATQAEKIKLTMKRRADMLE